MEPHLIRECSFNTSTHQEARIEHCGRVHFIKHRSKSWIIGVVCLPDQSDLVPTIEDCLREWNSNAVFFLTKTPPIFNSNNARVDIAKSCSEKIPGILESCNQNKAWSRVYAGETQKTILRGISIMKDEVECSKEFAATLERWMKNNFQKIEYATIVGSGAHEAEMSILAFLSLLVFPTPIDTFYPRSVVSVLFTCSRVLQK